MNRIARDAPANFTVHACGRPIAFDCSDPDTAAVLRAAFGHIQALAPPRPPACRIVVTRAGMGRFRVDVHSRPASSSIVDAERLLFHVDKQLTLTLQRESPGLLFLHAAAIGSDGRVAVLAAPPGTGKSTLTLALLYQGYEYFSDEIAPVDVTDCAVHPYAHAVCLKSRPPTPYTLPQGSFEYGGRHHVPPDVFAGGIARSPSRIGAIFFMRRSGDGGPLCGRVSPARAAAHLLANALNAAAHADTGLDAVVSLSRTAPCFELECTDLKRAADAVSVRMSRFRD